MAPIAFHDPTGFGHAPNLLAGLVTAAERRGRSTVVWSPTRPGSVGDPATTSHDDVVGPEAGGWGHSPEHVDWRPGTVPDPVLGPARRRFLAGIAGQAADARVAAFAVTTFDGYLLSTGARLTLPPASVVVLHSAHPYLRMATAKQRARRELTRSSTRALAHRGIPIVVHSHRAAAAIRAAVPSADVRVLAFPVWSALDPTTSGDGRQADPAAGPPANGVRLLFPGEPRPEKGFELVVDALDAAGAGAAIDTFEISGRVPRSAAAGLQRLAATPTVVDQVPDGRGRADYLASFGRASLAVLPLTDWYPSQGRISAALLDVVAHGLPLVTTSQGAELLPAGFAGAVVVDRPDAASLAAAIRAAVDDLDGLAERARATGPVAAAAHTYEAYLDGLLRAAAPA